jgi:S1-C subfamily serine protease
MSAALATAPMASARATASAFARRSGRASAARGTSASVPGRRPSLARRAAAVDVIHPVEEDDEVSPTDSIDDDDLPFDLDEYKAVVKLLVTFQEPDWVNPWSNKTAQRSTGSGCVIRRHDKGGGGVILTAAHVVANATFIQVQLANSPEKHVGKVVSVLHEVDLALVEVQEGLEDVEPVPLPLGKEVRLPKLREKVYVLGFPVGGNDLSITEGVVSRIEVQSYSHSHARALAVTVDAAINSGNSGGPVLSQTTGGLVGVAFQGYAGSSVENQGHMVPAPVVDRFLRGWEADKDAAQKEPRLPSLGVHLQLLNSPSLRKFLKMRDGQTGVMVTHVEHGSSAEGTLQSGDVLMEVDGVKLANDGSSVFLGQRLAMVAILQARFIGDEVPIKLLRDGEEMTKVVTLKALRQLVPRGQYDIRPPFVLVGGLLFQPLSLEYLQSWGGDLKDAPTHLVEEYYDGISGPDKKEVVVLSQVLSDDVNVGFTFDSVGLDYVASVNNQPVADMEAFVEALRKGVHGADEFITLEVTRGNVRNVVVLEVTKLKQADELIQERYQIPTRHSVHFRDIHEK